MVRRAVVAHAILRPLGGAEGVAAWILHALAADHDTTLVCREAPDLAALDRRYGTSLGRHAVRVHLLPDPPLGPLRADNLRSWWFLRRARALARGADVVVSSDDEADLGEGAIQYVHYPRYVFRPRGGRDLGWYHAHSLAGAVMLEATARATGYEVARMRRNLTLCASTWVREAVLRLHGIDATVLHPPAAGTFAEVPWAARANGVVWAGRLWPDRRVERVIEVVERARARGAELTLALLGAAHDEAYAARIRSLARARAAWVTLEENVERARLAAVMSGHRYGLHGTAEEGFGMAPAELVRAGAICFLPRGGGQAEIVGGDDRYLYSTVEDGAEKLAAVARSSSLQSELRAGLASHRGRFAPERFVARFRELALSRAACRRGS